MNPITIISLFTGLILLVYGFVARLLNIYFFWDSRDFGWIFLLIALAGYLFTLIKLRRRKGKKTILVKIGFGILILGLAAIPFAIVMIKTSEAYVAAIGYIETNSQLKNEAGDIRSYSLMIIGGMEINNMNGAESGHAELNFTIHGTKKYKDISISLAKTPETDWQVMSLK